MGATGNMVFGAQYSHATSVMEVERLRALQLDSSSWSYDGRTIADDDDDNPELSGYQTLPEADTKDDADQDYTPLSTPITATGTFQGFSGTSGRMPDGGESSSSAQGGSASASGATAAGTTNSSGSSSGTKQQSFSPRSEEEAAAAALTPNTGYLGSATTSGAIEGMKTNARNILQDPLLILRGLGYEAAMGDMHLVGTEHQTDEVYALQKSKQRARFHKFKELLQLPIVDLEMLRKLSWSGVPTAIRPIVWQLLVGYLPSNSDRRNVALERKRKEYQDGVQQTFARGIEGLDQTIWHQVFIDVPRTNPKMTLFQNQTTQRCLERILYSWAIRHPASSYVQGINDLVTPFFLVFLTAYIDEDQDPESYDISRLPNEILAAIEADSYWCLTKLLDGIQDNYTHAQPGIQRQIVKLRELICRIDAPLAAHLQSEHVEFIQFSFRWMNCLLMREVTLQHTIRMWDTYL
ncbi:GTPase-activating protein, partial [Dissophora globulifera]